MNTAKHQKPFLFTKSFNKTKSCLLNPIQATHANVLQKAFQAVKDYFVPVCTLFVMKMSSSKCLLPCLEFTEDICCLLTALGSGYATALFEKNRRGKSCSLSLHLKLSLDTSFSLSPPLKTACCIALSTADQNLKRARINVVICLNCPLDVWGVF